jgi:hypothetical protein
MHTFDHVLNWRLKVGSHLFPGPDGGTCINEAALVAAGFEYQPVLNADGMPDCFSRPICTFAMRLNDLASDNNRQRLLPYVTRLACADTPEVERRRAAYIRRRTWFFFDLLPFDRGLKVLEGALAIGRQADPFASDEVQARLDAVKAEAPTFRSRAAHPPSSKVTAIRPERSSLSRKNCSGPTRRSSTWITAREITIKDCTPLTTQRQQRSESRARP